MEQELPSACSRGFSEMGSEAIGAPGTMVLGRRSRNQIGAVRRRAISHQPVDLSDCMKRHSMHLTSGTCSLGFPYTSRGGYSRSCARSSWYSSSLAEPAAMLKNLASSFSVSQPAAMLRNLASSFSVSQPQPSAMLEGTEVADLRR